MPQFRPQRAAPQLHNETPMRAWLSPAGGGGHQKRSTHTHTHPPLPHFGCPGLARASPARPGGGEGGGSAAPQIPRRAGRRQHPGGGGAILPTALPQTPHGDGDGGGTHTHDTHTLGGTAGEFGQHRQVFTHFQRGARGEPGARHR